MTEQERFEAWFFKHKREQHSILWGANEPNAALGCTRRLEASHNDLWEAWQAAQQKEGFVLVPIEPTDEALDRAVAFALQVGLSSDYRWTDYMRDLYARFLNLPDSKQQHRSRHETKTHD